MWPFKAKPLTRVAVLELRPNDTVVLETTSILRDDEATGVRVSLAESLCIDANRVLIVCNATLKVLRHGEPPPPSVILEPGRYF